MSRRKKHTKRIFLLAIIGLCLVGYVGYAVVRPLPSITPSLTKLSAPKLQASPITWPGYGESAVGAVGYGVTASSGTQTPLPTASIAKIMTALCVLQAKPLAAGE